MEQVLNKNFCLGQTISGFPGPIQRPSSPITLAPDKWQCGWSDTPVHTR